jgi:hypothetical protein
MSLKKVSLQQQKIILSFSHFPKVKIYVTTTSFKLSWKSDYWKLYYKLYYIISYISEKEIKSLKVQK